MANIFWEFLLDDKIRILLSSQKPRCSIRVEAIPVPLRLLEPP